MAETQTETKRQQKTEMERPPRPARQGTEPGPVATRPEGEGGLQVFREFDHAMLDLERRMDRVLRNTLGEGHDLWRFPILQGLSLQPGADGRLRLQPFGHLRQPSLDQFAEGFREPVLTWRTSDDGSKLEFRAEVPGVKKADLDVEIRPEGLRIEAQGKDTRYSAYCNPGVDLDADSAEANYEDGVLTVTCSKTEPTTPKGKRLTIR